MLPMKAVRMPNPSARKAAKGPRGRRRRATAPSLSAWWLSPGGLSAAGSVLLWAALPPWGLWPLAFLAPIAWVLLVRRLELAADQPQSQRTQSDAAHAPRWSRPLRRLSRLLRRPYGQVWCGGFLFWLLALYWLTLPHWATCFGWVALSFYLAFYLPLFVGLSRVMVHRWRVSVIIAAPVVWTGLELVRAHFLGGFTMASLGHAPYRWLALIQVSDLAGGYAVSFVVMFAAACLARMLPLAGQTRTWWPLAPLALVLGVVLAYGYTRLSTAEPSGRSAKIAVVQGTFDTTFQPDAGRGMRIFQDYLGRSREALDEHPDTDLVMWPESMLGEPLVAHRKQPRVPPGYDVPSWQFEQLLVSLEQKREAQIQATAEVLSNVPLLTGGTVHDYGPLGMDSYNSALLWDGTGRLQARYDKMHAVIFGEYVPLGDYLPWIYEATPLSRGIREGEAPVAIPAGELTLAPNICYETVIPHLMRRHVRELRAAGQEPDVLANLTNDGWFWGSSELELHLICSVFRAVECRKPLLVAANTGISASIDAHGRVLHRSPKRANDWFVATVRPSGMHSLYMTVGDWPAGLCLLGCLVAAYFGAVDRWRERQQPA